jgi:BirA family biotin operon repressor/biotin-[acetyl-CoA-carboxylase] ligase
LRISDFMILDKPLKLFCFDIIDSTNKILWQLLGGGVKPPLAAIACQQTAGRGQWGRQWQSPRGGLYLSLAFNPEIPAAAAPHLTLCSAWGIAHSLRQQQIPVQIKWPNDLTLQGRKLGGIKTETRVQKGKISQAVIGVGINWTNPVPAVGINLQSFWGSCPKPPISSLEMLAAIAINGLLAGSRRYLEEGIDSLLSSYVELLENCGQNVIVNGCSGVVVGVTNFGELRIRFQASGAATEVNLPPGTISLGYSDK